MNKYTDQFELKERPDGELFYWLKEGNEPLHDLIYRIHQKLFYGAFSCDWIYESIYDAFERLEQCESDADYERASCEIEADAYTNDLLDWAKYGFAREYIQEEHDEGPKPSSLDQLISSAQIRAKERIYSYVWEFIEKNKEEESAE